MTVTTVTYCQMTNVTAADIPTCHSSIIITDVIADVIRIWVVFSLVLLTTGVATRCTGCTCAPRAEKIFWAKLQGKVASAPPGRECTPRQRKSQIFQEIGEMWTV